jgi:hypothetical protein
MVAVAAGGRSVNIGVDEQRESLGMDILQHDPEAIRTSHVGGLYLVRQLLDKVLVDDASEAVINVRMWEAKWRSLLFRRLVQSWRSFDRSISSAIQKDVKNVRMWETKGCSWWFRRLVQSWRSFDRSISSTVQKDASAVPYICQI